jgi:ABC-type multidrug transport system fused ATPase/permease subunit
LTVGQLISFFGYAVFLSRPFGTFIEFIQKWMQALVSARKTLGVLNQQPPWRRPTDPRPWVLGEIRDERTGFTAHPGELTIIVTSVPDDSAALADRIGRYLPVGSEAPSVEEESAVVGAEARRLQRDKAAQRAAQAAHDEAVANGHWGVTIGDTDLGDIDLGDVRQHIVVADAGAAVFAGTLQHLVDPLARHTRDQAEQVLWVSSADDVWEALPDGWQGRIDERGRGLSGGQRQRLVLARSLLLDPDVLVMVEPTSAVDAHTEARIAERLPVHRAGRTTILTTVSPLWLRHADRVVLLDKGVAIAAGTHAELMATSPAYRDVVVRGEDEAPAHPSASQPDAAYDTSDHVADELAHEEVSER